VRRFRRVKCDEEKPFCERCLKFGVDCEGYETQGRLNACIETSPRKIISKTRHHQAFLLSSLGRLPFTAVFHDNREYSYFQYFQQEAALDISSHFDESLFNHVIIQSSWKEPSLCQLIASVGALYKAETPKSLNRPKSETDPHRQYAFQQYGRALKLIQTRISADQYPDTTRVALIASLLIYCFENLYGDLDSALGHLEDALKLMQKQLARAGRRYKHSINSAPTPHLDDDLVAAFFRLDSGLLSRDNISNAKNIGSRLGMRHLEDICEIPKIFLSISEARNYLESIQFPTIPSLANDLVQTNELPLFKDIDMTAKNLYTTLSSQLCQWNVAFAPLYCETLTTKGKKDFISAATLRVRALSTELALQRVCARDPLSLHVLNIVSREIVDLSRLVARDRGFLKSFVWDCGIVPGLSIVIAACIETSIREEALQVLKDIVPRREGAWDSLTAVKFGEYCLQMSR
jgi:Fungal Zn(2)-Cys(6) binuclear cluster domain